MAKFINALGKEYQPEKFLTYDDVLLEPQYSKIKSRKDPNVSVKLGKNIYLNIPIVTAPMDTVVDHNMYTTIDNMGGLAIFHRFYNNKDKQYKDYYYAASNKPRNWFLSCSKKSIELDKDNLNTMENIARLQRMNCGICIDLAHGDLEDCLLAIEHIRSMSSNIDIISGSICTPDAAERSIDAGATILRVGVGGGSMCTTRVNTGHGSSNLTAIMRIKDRIGDTASIVADGGIRNSGDIVKAIAAGANAVMLGKLLAGTDESPGDIVIKNGNKFKKYRGMASQEIMDITGKNGVAPEGESTLIPYKGSVVHIINNLIGGLKSGMSYSNASTLKELQEKAIFTEISYHSYIEGTPHGKTNE